MLAFELLDPTTILWIAVLGSSVISAGILSQSDSDACNVLRHGGSEFDGEALELVALSF